MNTTRVKSAAGVALPFLKNETFSVDEELIKKVCVGLSEWVVRQEFKWLGKDQVPYTDSESDRHKLFAAILDERNVLEYLRVAATIIAPAGNGRRSMEKTCGVHSDDHNSIVPHCPASSNKIYKKSIEYKK